MIMMKCGSRERSLQSQGCEKGEVIAGADKELASNLSLLRDRRIFCLSLSPTTGKISLVP
jgi:hypothetical protein